MRVLIWVFLAMILMNVVVYLWPDKANFAPHVQNEKTEINANYVRLNKEVEDDFYKKQKAPIEKESELTLAPAKVGAEQPIQQSCYRVGPFIHEENFELAQAVLVNASIEYKKARRESKETNVFRVYLGPYENRAEAIDARTDLRRKKILDHFIRQNTEGRHVVSLGIYTTQESVDDAVELFSKVVDGVKSAQELVALPESYWLYFSLLDENKVRQQLLLVDWGEIAAKMGKYTCEA